MKEKGNLTVIFFVYNKSESHDFCFVLFLFFLTKWAWNSNEKYKNIPLNIGHLKFQQQNNNDIVTCTYTNKDSKNKNLNTIKFVPASPIIDKILKLMLCGSRVTVCNIVKSLPWKQEPFSWITNFNFFKVCR